MSCLDVTGLSKPERDSDVNDDRESGWMQIVSDVLLDMYVRAMSAVVWFSGQSCDKIRPVSMADAIPKEIDERTREKENMIWWVKLLFVEYTGTRVCEWQ